MLSSYWLLFPHYLVQHIHFNQLFYLKNVFVILFLSIRPFQANALKSLYKNILVK